MMKRGKRQKHMFSIYDIGIFICIIAIIVALVLILEPVITNENGGTNSSETEQSTNQTADAKETTKTNNNQSTTNNNSSGNTNKKIIDGVEIVQPDVGINEEINEEYAKKLALKQFKILGETDITEGDLKLSNIHRHEVEYYYINSRKNTIEIKKVGGIIARLNSVVIN